jgi:excisionase family DNA binding protein
MDIVDDLELMTVDEVCALLKVRKWFVYDAVSSGRLVGVKLGRALRFRRRDIARFIDRGLTAAS